MKEILNNNNKKEKERKMFKKPFIYIFIYTLLVGCNIQNPVYAGDCEYDLEISAPSLHKSFTGTYRMEWADGSVQTFTTLAAEIKNAGAGRYIYFTSNKSIEWPVNSGKHWESINNHSYTRRDGTTNAVFCSWSSMVGETAIVTATFIDEHGHTHTDKIKIVIRDDE